ncbi:MFS transporter [Methanococcus maripaludis]|uniref:MFS family permease n=1 Tax=Methanococcus maripaludis TaxID=39152 RepID=A0A7J9PWZ5_METMI|nr:MFS transporter [Methanococcus maripaludis]MBA2869420.1 MFS family permease [Methanococcus maripaludis]
MIKLDLNGKTTGFLGATFSLFVVFASSSAPIPLLNTYLKTLDLTSGDLSMTAVTYFVGCVLSLLVFARVSNHLGRRPVALATLGIAVIGCINAFDWKIHTGNCFGFSIQYNYNICCR